MEEKKYQVFISSTYVDLKEERKSIFDTLLMADCIPAGMEDFVATDEAQFEVIKQVIDLCDYYILILGERYGSINEKEGISYTEMEYNYAKEKGIPVLVFAKNVDVNNLNSGEDIKIKAKFTQFRERVMENRLASQWENIGDLSGKVAISILKAIKNFPRPGWVRNPNTNNEELLEQIVELQKENKDLQIKMDSLKEEIKEVEMPEDLAFEGYKYTLHFNYYFQGVIVAKDSSSEVDVYLDDIFKHVSLYMNSPIDNRDFEKLLLDYDPCELRSDLYAEIFDDDLEILKRQFILLGLFQENDLGFYLTKKGIQLRDKLNAIYKDGEEQS